MIAFATAVRSPWALVVGGVTAALVKSILSHWLLPGERNALYFDKAMYLVGFTFSEKRWRRNQRRPAASASSLPTLESAKGGAPKFSIIGN